MGPNKKYWEAQEGSERDKNGNKDNQSKSIKNISLQINKYQARG